MSKLYSNGSEINSNLIRYSYSLLTLKENSQSFLPSPTRMPELPHLCLFHSPNLNMTGTLEQESVNLRQIQNQLATSVSVQIASILINTKDDNKTEKFILEANPLTKNRRVLIKYLFKTFLRHLANDFMISLNNLFDVQ